MDGKNILEVNESSELNENDVLIVGCDGSLQKIRLKNFKSQNKGKLIINGQEYDGATDTEINLMNETIMMSSENRTVSLDPNKMYSFPEMVSLSYSLNDKGSSDETYVFSFVSGDTATVLSHPATIKTDLVVKANAAYVIKITNNALTYSELEI